MQARRVLLALPDHRERPDPRDRLAPLAQPDSPAPPDRKELRDLRGLQEPLVQRD